MVFRAARRGDIGLDPTRGAQSGRCPRFRALGRPGRLNGGEPPELSRSFVQNLGVPYESQEIRVKFV